MNCSSETNQPSSLSVTQVSPIIVTYMYVHTYKHPTLQTHVPAYTTERPTAIPVRRSTTNLLVPAAQLEPRGIMDPDVLQNVPRLGEDRISCSLTSIGSTAREIYKCLENQLMHSRRVRALDEGNRGKHRHRRWEREIGM